MSIINVYIKKEGKTTWIEMDTFPLFYSKIFLYMSKCLKGLK